MRAVRLTASAQVTAEKADVVGILICGGADAATVQLYNEADDSKTAASRVAKLGVGVGLSDDATFGEKGIYCSAGVYAEITGTTPEVYVYLR